MSPAQYAATHAATETGELACGTWTRGSPAIAEIGTDSRTQPRAVSVVPNSDLDHHTSADRRLEALFVLSITLGLRPGELRKLTLGPRRPQ